MPREARYYSALPDGRIQCDLCPRHCRLHDGQRGLCFVRAREGDAMALTTYGRSSGFCVDPIEKKPLNHFLPGTPVLSFGTAGCNLTCKFCQNWDISKSREFDRLMAQASPAAIAAMAAKTGSRSVAFTYNDPVIFLEYAVDVAQACHERGIKTVARLGRLHRAGTAGRVLPPTWTRRTSTLKGFTEDFYRTLCTAELAPVLDTLKYLKHETDVWFEITTLLIPGHNDSDAELAELCAWVADALGPDVPVHFSAFHPGLADARPAADPASDAAPRACHRHRPRPALRLRRQRPRSGGRQHLVPRLRKAGDRPRLVPVVGLEPDRRRPLQILRHGVRRGVRRPARHLGAQAAADPSRHGVIGKGR